MCSLQVYSKVIQLCIYMHLFFFYASILFQMLFPFRLLQNIEQNSLCPAVGLTSFLTDERTESQSGEVA